MQRFQKPFTHCVIDNAFSSDLVAAASRAWPDETWNDWSVRYDNPLEKKLACFHWDRFSPAISLLMSALLTVKAAIVFPSHGIDRENGMLGLLPDCSLRGGGMHSCGNGGFLDLHEDSDHHPFLQWSRQVNGVLFLNDGWKPEWGGQLELWDSNMTGPPVKIAPIFNRLVLFKVVDGGIHGFPDPIQCPTGVQRKSLAAFWYSPPEQDKPFNRPRARFVGRPGEDDPIKEKLRIERARL